MSRPHRSVLLMLLSVCFALPKGALCQPVEYRKPPIRLDLRCVAYVVHNRDVADFRLLLRDPAALRWADDGGRTLLHWLAGASGPQVDTDKLETEGVKPGQRLPLLPTAPIMEMAGLLVETGAEIDPVDKGGKTPLLCAAQAGGPEMVALLLQRGAKVAVRDGAQRTVLHHIADRGNLETAQELLAAGADANAVDVDGRTPLHDSASSSTTSVARLLLDHGAEVNAVTKTGDTPLHLAAVGRVETMLLLIERGAKLDARNNEGDTPLHGVARRGLLENARLLVAHGASLTITNAAGQTPAALASAQGPVMTAGLLADLLQPPAAGREASREERLYRAMLLGDLAGAHQCLKEGARGDVLSKAGILPLWAAVTMFDEVDLVHELVKAGAPLNATCTEHHSTALMAAISAEHPHAAAALINEGADLNLTGIDGLTALHLAAVHDQRGVASLLLDKGARVGATLTGSGETPLHMAAKYGRLEMCKLLLAHGANLTALDKTKRKPSDVVLSEYWQVQEYLREQEAKAGAEKP